MTGRICKSSHHRRLPIFIVVSVGRDFYKERPGPLLLGMIHCFFSLRKIYRWKSRDRWICKSSLPYISAGSGLTQAWKKSSRDLLLVKYEGWREETWICLHTLIKKKIKCSSSIRKFRMEQLQSHIWLTASSSICAFPHILGSPFSYMTLQLLHHSEFPYICGKFDSIFHQCIVHTFVLIFFLVSQYNWIVPEDQELWEVPAERSDSFKESSETMDDLHTAHS